MNHTPKQVGVKLAICDLCRDEVPESELKEIGKHDYRACKSCRRFYTPTKK